MDNSKAVQDGASSDPPQPFSPSKHINSLPEHNSIAALRAELEESLKKRPLPDAPFEGSKESFGLTHEKFEHLRRKWVEYLKEPGENGFEDDTWA
jgi:hypothetical protein